MKQQIETCPKCGKHVVGTMQLGMGDGFVQGFAQGAINEGLNMVVPGLGTIAKYTGVSKKAGSYIRESVTTHTDFEFACPCGHTWVSSIGNKEERIPEEILRGERARAIRHCSNAKQGNYVAAAITGVIAALCIWYLIVNPFIVEVPDHNWLMGDYMRQDWQWDWIGMFFLACGTGIPALFNLSKGIEKSDDLGALKAMSLSTFKNSSLRKKYK